LPGLNITICPYCAEEIKDETVKCKHCGEWVENNKQSTFENLVPSETAFHEQKKSKKFSGLKTGFGITTLIAFIFIGYVVGSWIGLFVAIFLWLVAAGSIGLSQDISDAGEAARQRKRK